MAKYRRKPVVMDAQQWFKNGDHSEDKSYWVTDVYGEISFLSEGKLVRRFNRPDVPGTRQCRHCIHVMEDHGWIDTLEGGHIVCPGDWIMTGTKGEHWPVKPDIFANTYEKVEDETV